MTAEIGVADGGMVGRCTIAGYLHFFQPAPALGHGGSGEPHLSAEL
jgi:hypothetical protein